MKISSVMTLSLLGYFKVYNNRAEYKFYYHKPIISMIGYSQSTIIFNF